MKDISRKGNPATTWKKKRKKDVWVGWGGSNSKKKEGKITALREYGKKKAAASPCTG